MHLIRHGHLYLSQVFPPHGPVCWTAERRNALAFASCGCAAYWLGRIREIGCAAADAEVVDAFDPEFALES
jgi:hypothetical protein